MIYSEVIAAALAYTNRSDEDVAVNMGVFLEVVESNINLYLIDHCPTLRATFIALDVSTFTPYSSGSSLEEVAVPEDFLAVKSLLFNDKVLQYLPLEALTMKPAGLYYTILNGKIITKLGVSVGTMALSYAAKIPNLTSVATANWISTFYPSVYVAGVVAEVYAFVMNTAASVLWTTKFEQLLSRIVDTDFRNEAAGTPKQTRETS